MTLTCDQSDPVIGGVASKRKMSSTENSKLDSKISRTDFSIPETEKVKLHPSQIDAEFRILQSLIPQIANKQQLSEVKSLLNVYLLRNIGCLVFKINSAKISCKYSKIMLCQIAAHATLQLI